MSRAVASALAALFLLACSRAPAAPEAAEPPAPPAAPQVTAARTDLVFSYTDPITQGFVTTSSLGAIPEAARGSVLVTDLSRSPEARQAARYVFVADLREARPDGTYPVSVASRHATTAQPGAGAEGAVSPTTGVVMYTTSWCGVCRQAKSLLKQLGVPFTERDVEASRSAAEELAAKARQAGINPGGVPVIDVGGVLLQGLDEGVLRQTLRDKGLLR